jgi:hypothetical protein
MTTNIATEQYLAALRAQLAPFALSEREEICGRSTRIRDSAEESRGGRLGAEPCSGSPPPGPFGYACVPRSSVRAGSARRAGRRFPVLTPALLAAMTARVPGESGNPVWFRSGPNCCNLMKHFAFLYI